MFTLLLIAALVGGMIWFGSFSGKEYIEKHRCFSENSIVKRFNRLLGDLKKDNLSVVKDKLLNTLAEYRTVKKAQFVENRTYLTEALTSVKEQCSIMGNAVYQKAANIRKLKGQISKEEGARLVYEYEIHENTYKRLQTASVDLENKIVLLDTKVVEFDGLLALRKAQIVAMIADNVSLDDNSFIDLKLDSLEQEFKHIANENENRKHVDKLMGDSTTPQKIKFDQAKYEQLFEAFE